VDRRRNRGHDALSEAAERKKKSDEADNPWKLGKDADESANYTKLFKKIEDAACEKLKFFGAPAEYGVQVAKLGIRTEVGILRKCIREKKVVLVNPRAGFTCQESRVSRRVKPTTPPTRCQNTN
jgi:hypothetical protein